MMDILASFELTSVSVKLFIASGVLFLIYDWWCHQHFQRRGIPVGSYFPMIGSILEIRNGLGYRFAQYNKKYGKVFGWYLFRAPLIAITDVDMLKQILVKDFSHFVNRRPAPPGTKILDKGLVALQDDKWKQVRSVVTPSFSSVKMKQMSSMVTECCDTMLDNVSKAEQCGTPIDCRKLYGGFTMDTVAWCGFGLKVDSQKNKDDEFVMNVQRALASVNTVPFIVAMLIPAMRPILDYFNLGNVPLDVTDFFSSVTNEICKLRNEEECDLVKSRRIDMLQLLLNAHNDPMDTGEDGAAPRLQNTRHKRALTNDEITAQAITFFLAGYETTSTLLGFASYLLALNQDVQDKLYAEIEDVTPTRDLVTHDKVNKMTYLDMVISEALRYYPPVGNFLRYCNKTFSHNGITIDKGTAVIINIWSIHRDEKYWPDPDKFDPERFSPERTASIQACSYLPFGYGPRNCVGMRFALMQAKIALVRILQMYRLDVCPETQIPLKLGWLFLSAPKEGIKLRPVSRK